MNLRPNTFKVRQVFFHFILFWVFWWGGSGGRGGRLCEIKKNISSINLFPNSRREGVCQFQPYETYEAWALSVLIPIALVLASENSTDFNIKTDRVYEIDTN